MIQFPFGFGGSQITASGCSDLDSSTEGKEYKVRQQFYDSGGGDLGLGSNPSYAPLTANAYTVATVTDTPPASTAYVRTLVYLRDTAAGQGVPGDVFYLSGMVSRADDESTFVPSLRIVGDIDMRADLAYSDLSTGDRRVLSTRNGNSGYEFYGAATGAVYARYGTGSDARGAFVAAASSLVEDVRAVVRVTFDVSAGTWQAYIDGVAETPVADVAGAGDPSGTQLAVGAFSDGTLNYPGDLYWAEVRDGIDGPVVARFDAADWVESTS